MKYKKILLLFIIFFSFYLVGILNSNANSIYRQNENNIKIKTNIILDNFFIKVNDFNKEKKLHIYNIILQKINNYNTNNDSIIFVLKIIKNRVLEKIKLLEGDIIVINPIKKYINNTFNTSIGYFGSDFKPNTTNEREENVDLFLHPEYFNNLLNNIDTSKLRNSIVRRQVSWNFVQGKDSEHYNFNHPMLKIIKTYHELGIEVIPTIQLNAKWTLGDQNCSKNKSFPPKDFTENWNPIYGNSKSVYNFIKRFAEEYDGMIKAIVLNNEVDQNDNTWCEPSGDRHKYIALAATAKKALKDANTSYQIKLADSGMMGSSFQRLALEKALLDRKNTIAEGKIYPREKEIEILESYDDRVGKKVNINSIEQIDWDSLYNNVSTTVNKRASLINAKLVIEGLNGSIIHPQLNEKVLDIYNFHDYGSSASLSNTLNYIKSNYSKGGELITNEMGITSSNHLIIEDKGPITEKLIIENSSLNTKIASSELVKKYTILMNSGVSLTVLFTFPTIVKNGIPFLTTFFIDYSKIEKAKNSLLKGLRKGVKENIQTFINLQNRIGGKILDTKLLKNNTNNLQTYTFEFNNKTVKVMWVRNIINKTTVSIVKDSNNCTLYDIYGNIKNDLIISEKPIYEECMK